MSQVKYGGEDQVIHPQICVLAIGLWLKIVLWQFSGKKKSETFSFGEFQRELVVLCDKLLTLHSITVAVKLSGLQTHECDTEQSKFRSLSNYSGHICLSSTHRRPIKLCGFLIKRKPSHMLFSSGLPLKRFFLWFFLEVARHNFVCFSDCFRSTPKGTFKWFFKSNILYLLQLGK